MTLKKVIHTKWGASIELFLFFLISILPIKLGFIIPLLVFISIGSMKSRKLKWVDVGFSFPDFKIQKIIFGVTVALIYLLLFQYLISPLLNSWLPDVNLNAIGNIKGDYQKLIIWVITSWTIGAIFEEFIFRGYLLSRLKDLFGNKLPAQILNVVLAAIPFGFIHAYQGTQGIITAALFGIFQSIIYLVNKKLTIPMIAHGTFDTIGFVRLFSNNIS
jgi:membrane protease YdiL (CAAX protease family)